MDYEEELIFIKKMSKQSLILAIIAFIISYIIRMFDLNYIFSSFYASLIFSMLGGLELIISFDWYFDGRRNRPFGILPLYLIGLIAGVIIFYLIILNIPINLFSA